MVAADLNTVKLEEQRSNARLRLFEDIPDFNPGGCPDNFHDTWVCEWRSSEMLLFLAQKIRRESESLDFRRTTLRGVLAKISTTDDPQLVLEYKCGNTRKCVVPKLALQRVCQRIFDEAGLCLTCFRNKSGLDDACTHAEDKKAAGSLVAG